MRRIILVTTTCVLPCLSATAFAVPAITSATYDAGTATLVVTGSGFTANGGGADIDASRLAFTGEGSETYTLTDSADVNIDSATQFTVVLSATDRDRVNPIMNKSGAASTGGTAYTLAADDDYNTAVTAGDTADAGNAVTINNVPLPTITGATFDYAARTLTVTGTGFVKAAGPANDIDFFKLNVVKAGIPSATRYRQFIEITNSTSFTVTDVFYPLINKNGPGSTEGYGYAIKADDDWSAGTDPALNIVVGEQILTAVNVPLPTLATATYYRAAGLLVIEGEFLYREAVAFSIGLQDDIDVSLLTITGQGGTSYTLTDTPDCNMDYFEFFSLPYTCNILLSPADRAALDPILNLAGTAALDATPYNIVAAEDWNRGADPALNIADNTGNTFTVVEASGITITSARFVASGTLLELSGSHFVPNAGGLDIDASKITIVGEGGESYTLTDSADVETVSIEHLANFRITLSATDKEGILRIMNRNGTTSTDGTHYRIVAADDFVTAVTLTDTSSTSTGNFTLQSRPAPLITAATYDAGTGVLSVTGSNFAKAAGPVNDIDLYTLSVLGDNGVTYHLSTPGAEITSTTQFTVTLNINDRLWLATLLNNNGTVSNNGTTYNLAAGEDWNAGIDPAVVIADLSGNPITVSNAGAPVPVPAVPEPAGDPRCAASAVISGDFVHNCDGPLTNVTLTPGATVTGGTLTGTITNDGTLRDVTIAPDAEVTGGTLAGTITNNGTVSDVMIAPNTVVTGGTLAGTITNDGTLRDVELESGTVINGGTVSGTLTGAPGNPAVINSHIDADAVLENVIIGAGATLSPDATLSPNVIFASPDNIPPGMDLTGIFPPLSPGADFPAITARDLDIPVSAADDPGASNTLLAQLRALDDFAGTGAVITQDSVTGKLMVRLPGTESTLLPVSVVQGPAGTDQGIFVTDTGDVRMVTAGGQYITFLPILNDLQALRRALGKYTLTFDARANMVITSPETPPRTYMARADVLALSARRSIEEGIHVYQRDFPANLIGISVIYRNDANQIMEQDMVPVPADAPSLQDRLDRFPEVNRARIGINGDVTVEAAGGAVKGLPDYEVILPGADTETGRLRFINLGDRNGDGEKDFMLVFPDQRQQRIYIYP